MRIAYFSPLYPAITGTAYNSENLLPYLAKRIKVDVFIENCSHPGSFKNGFYIYNHHEFETRFARDKYDLVVYEVGNSSDHLYIYPYLIKYPGITVLHDYILQDFFDLMTANNNDWDGYNKELIYNYGEKGENLADRRSRKIWTGFEKYKYPLIKRIIDSSLGIIVHSEYLKKEISGKHTNATVKKINIGVPVSNNISKKNDLKRSLGIPYSASVAGMFGPITPSKRPDIIIQTFHGLLQWVPNSYLLIVGEILDNRVHNLISDLQLEPYVRKMGVVSEHQFNECLLATDFAFNLRYPNAGDTSTNMLRLMSMGVPVIVSNYRHFSEIPDGSVLKIGIGKNEVKELGPVVARLAADKRHRKSIGEKAKERLLLNHNVEDASKAYYDFIVEIIKRKNQSMEAAHEITESISKELEDIGVTRKDCQAFECLNSAIKELGFK